MTDALDIVREHRERQAANERIVKAQRELPPLHRWLDVPLFFATKDWDRVRARFRLPAGERPW